MKGVVQALLVAVSLCGLASANDRFPGFLMAGTANARELDHARIVPVIKTRKWLDDALKEIKAIGSKQEQLVESFSDDLVVAYAEDAGKVFRYLTTDEYSGDPAKLRALAVDNLLRTVPTFQRMILNEHVSIISAGDDYTSGLLLADSIWAGGDIKVRGDIVVAIPARDMIMVTGSRSSMLKNFRAMAADFYAKGPHSLSDALFVYRNKRFVKFRGGM